MSMLDSLLSAAGTFAGQAEQTSQRALLLNAVIQWVNQEGGVSGLLEKFKTQGLGHLVTSWISSGQNLPISPEQIQQILGEHGLQHLSSATGQDTSTISNQLSVLLPEIVNKLTPYGEVPSGGFDAASALSMVQGFFGKNA